MAPGLGRSLGEGKGYPLQYSGLENSMDYIIHGVAELDMTERLPLSLSTTLEDWSRILSLGETLRFCAIYCYMTNYPKTLAP